MQFAGIGAAPAESILAITRVMAKIASMGLTQHQFMRMIESNV